MGSSIGKPMLHVNGIPILIHRNIVAAAAAPLYIHPAMKEVQYWRWYRPPVGRERTPRLSRYYMTEEMAATQMPPGSYKSTWTEMRRVHEQTPPLHREPGGCETPGGVYPWHELQAQLLKEQEDAKANAKRDRTAADAARKD